MLVLGLFSGRSDMLFANGDLFGWGRPSCDAASPAVIADAIHRDIIVDHGLIVGVVHHCHIYVGHGAVINKSAIAPISAPIAHACVAEAIVDSAIKSNVRPPISRMPNVHVIGPAPITGSPEVSNSRSDYPRPGHPEVAFRPPSPIAGHPDKSVSRARWLLIDRQRGREGQHAEDEQQTPKQR